MNRRLTTCFAALLACGLALLGCKTSKEYHFFRDDGQTRHYKDVATEIEYPDADSGAVLATAPPRTILNQQTPEYWPLKLEEAVQIALANSSVVRDLGGRIINNPSSSTSVYDPALQESHPFYGVEGALSAFDAELSTSLYWENNDRVINNILLGGGTNLFTQDRSPFQAQIAKRSATGGQFFFRNNTLYDLNNAPSNMFHSYYDTNFEAEVRHPFLQGAGIEFNRIAGPQANRSQPANGVAIARINADISLTQFESGLTTLVSDVENAYWDLYYAYRDLDAKIAARDMALEVWRAVNAQYQAGALRGEADREAQAREQFFILKAQVDDALSGAPRRATQTGVGTGGGAFLGYGGVYSSERKLRFLMGLPPADDRLIRPAEEPVVTRVVFDWDEISQESLARRVELRRQKWLIKRRELELLAARNYLLPRLDGTALYRWRGFGNDLFGANNPAQPFDNAVANLLQGNFQEWQMGLQLNVPLGFRQAIAGVRNAELQLARERSVLANQERLVIHELSETIAEVDRAFNSVQSQYDRRQAAHQQLVLIREKFTNPPPERPVPIEFLLDAQRRRVDADIAYFRSVVEYNLALKNVHFEKGSLLDHNEVFLAEGPWPQKAYRDAAKRAHERSAAKPLNYGFNVPRIISRGPYLQQTEPPPQQQLFEPVPVPVPAPEVPPPAPVEPLPGKAEVGDQRSEVSARVPTSDL